MKKITAGLLSLALCVPLLGGCQYTDKEEQGALPLPSPPSVEDNLPPAPLIEGIVPSTPEAGTSTPITPICFSDHASILKEYIRLLTEKKNGTLNESAASYTSASMTEANAEIMAAIHHAVSHIDPATAGYSLTDLNEDGTMELILMSDAYRIYTIFTFVDAKPTVLDLFDTLNHSGSIDQNGTIYRAGYGKGENWYVLVQTISKAGELDVLQFGCQDRDMNDTSLEYYQISHGERTVISEAEVEELKARYSAFYKDPAKTTYDAGLKYIGIWDTRDPEKDQNGNLGNGQQKTYSTDELIAALNITDRLAMALKNEIKVYDTEYNSLRYLGNMAIYQEASWDDASVSAIAIDGNGRNNVVVLEHLDTVIMLREYETTVLAYKFRHHALYNLRIDGSYSWNAQAGTVYGSSKLQFDGTHVRSVELERVEDDGTEHVKFYINGTEVTAEAFRAYCQNVSVVEKAVQYRWRTDLKIMEAEHAGK